MRATACHGGSFIRPPRTRHLRMLVQHAAAKYDASCRNRTDGAITVDSRPYGRAARRRGPFIMPPRCPPLTVFTRRGRLPTPTAATAAWEMVIRPPTARFGRPPPTPPLPVKRRRTVTTTPPTARRQAGLPPQRSSRPVAAASSADRCPLDTPTEDDRLDE